MKKAYYVFMYFAPSHFCLDMMRNYNKTFFSFFFCFALCIFKKKTLNVILFFALPSGMLNNKKKNKKNEKGFLNKFVRRKCLVKFQNKLKQKYCLEDDGAGGAGCSIDIDITIL